MTPISTKRHNHRQRTFVIRNCERGHIKYSYLLSLFQGSRVSNTVPPSFYVPKNADTNSKILVFFLIHPSIHPPNAAHFRKVHSFFAADFKVLINNLIPQLATYNLTTLLATFLPLLYNRITWKSKTADNFNL